MTIKHLSFTITLALGSFIPCSAFSISHLKRISTPVIVTNDEIASYNTYSSSLKNVLLREKCYSTFRLAAVTNDDNDSTKKRSPPGIQSYLTQLDQLSSDFSQNVYESKPITSQSTSKQSNNDSEVKPKIATGFSSYLTQLETNSRNNDEVLSQSTVGTALEEASSSSKSDEPPEKRTSDKYDQNNSGAKSYLSQLGEKPTSKSFTTEDNNGAGASKSKSLKKTNNSVGTQSYLAQLQQASEPDNSDVNLKKNEATNQLSSVDKNKISSVGARSYLDQLQITSSPPSSKTILVENDKKTNRSPSGNSVGTQSYLAQLQQTAPSPEKESDEDLPEIEADEVKNIPSGFGSYLSQLDEKTTINKIPSQTSKSGSSGIGSYLTQLEVSESSENVTPLDIQSTTKNESSMTKEKKETEEVDDQSKIVEKSPINSGFNSYMTQLENASNAKPPVASSNTNIRSGDSKVSYSGFGSYLSQLEQKSQMGSKKNINISLNESSSSTGIVSYLDFLGTSAQSVSKPETLETSPDIEENSLETVDIQEKDPVSPVSKSKTLDATPKIKPDDSRRADVGEKDLGESDTESKLSKPKKIKNLKNETIASSESLPDSIPSKKLKTVPKKGPKGQFRSARMKNKEFEIKSQEKINERNRKILEEAIASALGGTVLGLASGVAIDAGTTYEIIDLDLPAEPPAALSILLGGGTFIATNQDNAFSNKLRRYTGGAIIKAGEDLGTSVKTSINNTITNITAFPGRVVDGAKKSISNKVNKTIIEPVQSVINIPKRKMDDLKMAAKKRKEEVATAAAAAKEEQKANLEARRNEIAKAADAKKAKMKAKLEAAAAEKQAKIAERNAKKQKAIESRKAQANAKRQVAVAAAEARKAQLEEKRQLIAANEVKKLLKVEIEAKKVWAEAKRQEAIAAAETKRRDTELKRTIAINEKRRNRKSNSLLSMFRKPSEKDIELQERALAESEEKVSEDSRQLALATANLLQKQKATEIANRKKEAAELALANAKAKKTEQDLKTDSAKQSATAAQAKATGLLEKAETSKNAGTKKSKPRLLSFKSSPRGVPTLEKWRRNRNGSLTGFIKNSKVYEDGERVTTSPIVNGSFQPGEVVETGTGSKYYLV